MFTHPYISAELARVRQHELMEASRRHRLARQCSAQPGTTSRRRRLGVLALAAAAVGLALALTACGGSGSGIGTGSGSGSGIPSNGSAPVSNALQGTWVGPVPGDEGDCGTASGTWTFGPGADYQFNGIYADCAGVTDTGTYQVQGDVINFTPQGVQPFSVTYTLTDGALQLCDHSAMRCYTYYQQ